MEPELEIENEERIEEQGEMAMLEQVGVNGEMNLA